MTLMAHSTAIQSRHVEIITGPEPRMTDFFPIQHMFYLDVCFFPPFFGSPKLVFGFGETQENVLNTETIGEITSI